MPSDNVKIYTPEPPKTWTWLLILVAVSILAGGVGLWKGLFSPGLVETDPAPKPPDRPASTTGVPTVISPAIVPVDPRLAIAVLDEHLALHLPLTSSLDDHSAHHLPVSTDGVVQVYDGAAHFSGDAFLTVPHIPFDNRPFAFTVWIKPEGTVVGYGLLEQVDGGPGKHLHILLRDPDRPFIGFYMNDLRANQSITENSGWTHLAVQFTGKTQEIWIGGERVAERLCDPYLGTNGETRIGKAPMWTNVSTRCFKGAMRDLRIYDCALTPAQIRMLAGREGIEPPKATAPKEAF